MKAAQQLKVPFLGKIPLDVELVESGDNGTPFVAFGNQSTTAQAFDKIVKNIEQFISKPK